jgi:hypothetical protein
MRLRLSLPKKTLITLWNLAAHRRITVERYLEELIDAEQRKVKESKGKIIKFPVCP